MTGIEKIIAQINAESDAEVKKITGAATAEVRQIMADAEAQAEKLAAARREQADAREKEAVLAAESAAALAKRRALLMTRQALIGEAIADARQTLAALPDGEAVELLLKMAARYAGAAEGEMRLSARDLARLPADFAERLAAAAPAARLTVSPTAAQITGGFVLLCGEVEQNCSFESLFAAAKDQMQDIAQNELFCS